MVNSIELDVFPSQCLFNDFSESVCESIHLSNFFEDSLLV